MSWWSYINGTITVAPMGRTTHEKRYVLETVLDHLPRVWGSEGDMEVHIVEHNHYTSSCSHDEFGERTYNLVDQYGDKSRKYGMRRIVGSYSIVIHGSLRDRYFEEAKRDFMKWLTRLSKRVIVKEALVKIYDYDSSMIIDDDFIFRDMFEEPSWSEDNKDREPNWCEYLMWDRAKDSLYPAKLLYKYYRDQENDAEIERRMEYEYDD